MEKVERELYEAEMELEREIEVIEEIEWEIEND